MRLMVRLMHHALRSRGIAAMRIDASAPGMRAGGASRGAGIVWGATRRMICGHVWGALRTQAAVLGARSDGMTARAVPRRARAARGGMGCGRGQGCAVVCGASAQRIVHGLYTFVPSGGAPFVC